MKMCVLMYLISNRPIFVVDVFPGNQEVLMLKIIQSQSDKTKIHSIVLFHKEALILYHL